MNIKKILLGIFLTLTIPAFADTGNASCVDIAKRLSRQLQQGYNDKDFDGSDMSYYRLADALNHAQFDSVLLTRHINAIQRAIRPFVRNVNSDQRLTEKYAELVTELTNYSSALNNC